MERLGLEYIVAPRLRNVMIVILNGNEYTSELESPTVSEFVASLEIGSQPVLVELNGEAILTREFDDHSVGEGDTIEVIRMVAGG